MSSSIWKFVIDPQSLDVARSVATIKVPQNAHWLTAATQHGEMALWAIVDPSAPTVRQEIVIVGTGHDMPTGITKGQYLGTCHDVAGAGLVFHLFRGDVV
jgi:hypothetical protein